MRSATVIATSPSHNQRSNITWCAVIIDPPLPQPPYHPQGGRIGIKIYKDWRRAKIENFWLPRQASTLGGAAVPQTPRLILRGCRPADPLAQVVRGAGAPQNEWAWGAAAPPGVELRLSSFLQTQFPLFGQRSFDTLGVHGFDRPRTHLDHNGKRF